MTMDTSQADILALVIKIQADQAKAMTDAGSKNAEVLASSLEKLSPHCSICCSIGKLFTDIGGSKEPH